MHTQSTERAKNDAGSARHNAAAERRPAGARFGAGAACMCAVAMVIGGCNQSGRAGDSPEPAQVWANEREAWTKAVELTRAGQRAEEAGDLALAKVNYQRAISTYRDIPAAWNNMGVLLMAEGDNLSAAEAFTTAAELVPTDPKPYYNLGTMWEKMGYPVEAKKYYDQALKRDEYHLDSLRRVILLDSLQGSGDETTSDRIKRALLKETDPWWIERFQRENIRLRETLASKKRFSN